MEISAIVFDLGGVLIDWNPRHLYRKIFGGDEQKVEAFLRDVCTLEWNELQDAGRSLAEGTRALTGKFPHWKSEIEAYYGRWPEMIGGRVPGTAEIVRDLSRAGVALFALSNWSGETLPHIKDDYPELRCFRRIFFSFQYGLTKPDRRLFQIAIDGIGCPAPSLLFVDDNGRNVAAARAAGMQAVQFESAAVLRRQLSDLGIPF